MTMTSILKLILLSQALSSMVSARPNEQERVKLWLEKNVWPPQWHEETDGYKALQASREIEIMQIPGSRERWENWMQFTLGQIVPKFTSNGFDVVQVPPRVLEKLLNAVNPSLENFESIPYEKDVDVIYSPLLPRFVNIQQVQWDVIEDLKSYHEEWAGGMQLKATSAYGVRFYQNGSSLVMHHDKIHTHVISSIVHIAHEYDNDDEPWPIQIEDHDGNLHSVSLQPGQMLFYESAKCLHGRMTELKGKYYGSLFLHYQPVDENIWKFDIEDVIASVPPHWQKGVVEDKGSRWAGQGITIDSRSPAGSPPRVINGEFIHDNKSPFAYLGNLTLDDTSDVGYYTVESTVNSPTANTHSEL